MHRWLKNQTPALPPNKKIPTRTPTSVTFQCWPKTEARSQPIASLQEPWPNTYRVYAFRPTKNATIDTTTAKTPVTRLSNVINTHRTNPIVTLRTRGSPPDCRNISITLIDAVFGEPGASLRKRNPSFPQRLKALAFPVRWN